MTERARLVASLVAEVLGPREGPRETLPPNQDPVDEFITGVLAPHSAQEKWEDAEDELTGAEGSAADDVADPGATVLDAGWLEDLPAPSLDPRLRPASLGISFAVASEGPPVVDVCCSWARYRQVRDQGWTREPSGSIYRAVTCEGQRDLSDAAEPVRIAIRTQRSGGHTRVSIFLVNRSRPEGHHPVADDHIFQPQIRVRCGTGTRLVALDEGRHLHGDEDRELAFLYRDRVTLARGHLCSATWGEMDPERPALSGAEHDRPPFMWSDGRELWPDDWSDFSPADVRSDYVPVVPVNAPDPGWHGEGPPPELHPGRLSELHDAEALRAALQPLVEGYGNWVSGLVDSVGLEETDSTTADSLMTRCRRVQERISEGIDLLERDPDARLAFCFANQAMALQSTWANRLRRNDPEPNSWYPFQLAFQLLNLPSVWEPHHDDRDVCDLLWFPTGGGKTEAYLGLAAFVLAMRRIRAARADSGTAGGGVAVLSRYTLRLLTIQQFRRALALVTACEMLRVERTAIGTGWRPPGSDVGGDWVWGTSRFSIGLWVGGNVTPNAMEDRTYKDAQGTLRTDYGALSILEGKSGVGEPAQVLSCPACDAILAVPNDGYDRQEEKTLHIVTVDATIPARPLNLGKLSTDQFEVIEAIAEPLTANRATISIRFRVLSDVKPAQIDRWVKEIVPLALGRDAQVLAARGSRPGYFIRWARLKGKDRRFDFETFCPNPRCELNDVAWSEQLPAGAWPIEEAFERTKGESTRCPIPAWTVDEQVYARCPPMVVATVDKFARLAFEPKAGTLFGNVDAHNDRTGFFRLWAPPAEPGAGSLPRQARQEPESGKSVPVDRFRPPDLILQDELHLIEGPLGSMVGLYETAVEALGTEAGNGRLTRPKYIASTATVREAESQVAALYLRRLDVFPPSGLSIADSFFSSGSPAHPLDEDRAGRLYLGLCAPGRGAQTPIVRSWTQLLQHVADALRESPPPEPSALDPFWTLVAYFNAIRELAGSIALANQDIRQRLGNFAHPRELATKVELSSRVDSQKLPGLLDQLAQPIGSGRDAVDLVFTTSMFGTGVDVDRLGLMFVAGQPKTTASYIQATGRVGRRSGGLVVTFLRAARPRDLNHYEYFVGYHHSIYRFVEPITVNPFSPRARDRALGPVSVAILRNASDVPDGNRLIPVRGRWRQQQRLEGRRWASEADEMAQRRNEDEVEAIPRLFEERARRQPPRRRPQDDEVDRHAASELDRWQQLAQAHGDDLLYAEPSVTQSPSHHVVLGDLAHLVADLEVAYENAPNSLREVEETTTFRGRVS